MRVVQVYVGFGIMLYIGIKHRNLHHILEPLAFALGVIGVFGVFFTMMIKMLPAALMWPSIILTGASAVTLGILAGVAGPLEIFGAVGNILSYARLFAIGLSAAYLAYAANLIGRTIGGVTGFLVAALVIHPLFFALGLISPIMQPFRLQVVEFLTVKDQSAARLEASALILSAKDKIINGIFAEAARRLMLLSGAPQKQALKNLMAEACSQFGPGMVVTVKKEDLALAQQIAEELKLDAKLETDPQVKDGVIVSNPDRTSVVLNRFADRMAG